MLRSLLVIVFLATAVSAVNERERSRLALQNPDLFQGDILGFDPDDRNVIPHKQMRWTNKEIPYVLDYSVTRDRSLIESAMRDYHTYTCLTFREKTPSDKNYIKIFAGDGCYSYVGMLGRGEQPVSLGNGCMYKGTIIHELGHAIGFFHEQNRSDRDEYLKIYWGNISPGMASQFTKLGRSQNLLLTDFDYNSVMLYGNYAFSRDGTSMTMEAKNGRTLKEPYEKTGMSRDDISRVNEMYNC